jgi:hypothetical protein
MNKSLNISTLKGQCHTNLCHIGTQSQIVLGLKYVVQQKSTGVEVEIARPYFKLWSPRLSYKNPSVPYPLRDKKKFPTSWYEPLDMPRVKSLQRKIHAKKKHLEG